MERKDIILLLGTAFSFICITACVGGESWLVCDNCEITRQGLWKTCNESLCVPSSNNIPYWLNVIRVFGVLSSLASICSLGLSYVVIFFDKLKCYYVSIASFVAMIAIVVALSSYIKRMNILRDLNDSRLGWSCISGCFGILLSLVTGIYALTHQKFQNNEVKIHSKPHETISLNG